MPIGKGLLTVTGVVLAGWLASGEAGAFTVELTGTAPGKVLTITSDGASAVDVFAGAGDLISVDGQDPAEAVTRGAGCTGLPGDTRSSCGPLAEVSRVVFEGGAGDDRLAAGSLAITVEATGAGGADRLTSGTGSDTLDGGAGDDVLDSGFGDDRLLGDSGADDLTGGWGADEYDAGPDDDTLDSFDNFVDRTIACGDGADRLFADNGLDLTGASGCEVIAPEFLTPARVTGSALEGATLAYVPEPISGSASTLEFAWLRCAATCTPIPGATSAAYVPTAADVGQRLALLVTASNAAGTDESQADVGRPIARPFVPRRQPPAPPVVTPSPPVVPVVSPAAAVVAPARTAKLVGGRRSRTVDAGRAVCPRGATPCSVRLSATATRGGRRLKAGAATVRIAAGKSARLRFTLTGAATRELRRAGRLRLQVTLTSSRPAATTDTVTATATLRVRR